MASRAWLAVLMLVASTAVISTPGSLQHRTPSEVSLFVLAQMTGKHQGDFMGIPASGNLIDIDICDFFRVEDGSFIEHWGVMDAAGMQRQLSVSSS
jgi:SnoaL-like polyketide cyclase